MGFVSKQQERMFEKKHISRQRDRYLATDVLQRVESDRGYREKIQLLESFLEEHHHDGFVLDVGANTAGEAEVLSERGFDIVATDINEIALGLSRKRARSFGRTGPVYYAPPGPHSCPSPAGVDPTLVQNPGRGTAAS